MKHRPLTNALLAAALVFPATLAGAQPRPAPRPAPVPNPAPQPQRQQAPEYIPLAVGQTHVNAINRNDYAAPDGKYYDYYHVELNASSAYHFSVVGQGYPATIDILYEDGSPVNDLKVSQLAGNALVIYTPRQSGVYTIAVSTARPQDSGRYILHAVEGDERLPQRPNQTGGVTIPEGTQPFTGELNDQSDTSSQGRYFDYSILELEAGTPYCLYVESPDDGVYMDVDSVDGNPIEVLAIEQEGAFYMFTPTVSGRHAIITCTKQPGNATSYTGYAWVPRTGSSETILDQLTNESTLLDDGCYFDFHEIQLTAGTTYVIDVTSDEFDTLAYLFDGENNQLATNDNGENTGTNAQITYTPQTTGTYYVGISTTTPGATGGYMARVASGDRIGQDPGVRVTRGQEDHANPAGPVVGRWEVITFEMNGTTDEVPEGALVLEFTADGIGRSYMGGNLQDEGRYSVAGDQITMISNNNDNPDDTMTFSVQGDTMTLSGEFQPGQQGVMTLRRVAGDHDTPANNAGQLVGRWDLLAVVRNGQREELKLGMFAYEFHADGSTTYFEGGRPGDQGTYTLAGDQLTMTDGNGQDEVSTLAFDGDNLTVTIETAPGQNITLLLQRAGGEQPDPRNANDPAIQGRWEFVTVVANGETNQVPAGALAFEFLPNGTIRMYQNGQLSEQGEYTAQGDRLDVTIDNATENNTFRIEDDTLTIDTIIPPNTPATITLRRVDE